MSQAGAPGEDLSRLSPTQRRALLRDLFGAV